MKNNVLLVDNLMVFKLLFSKVISVTGIDSELHRVANGLEVLRVVNLDSKNKERARELALMSKCKKMQFGIHITSHDLQVIRMDVTGGSFLLAL